MTHASDGMQWYLCKGCGQPCGIGPPPSMLMAHAKPEKFAGIKGTVPCPLYAQCESPSFFFAYMAGERIESPTDIVDVPDRHN